MTAQSLYVSSSVWEKCLIVVDLFDLRVCDHVRFRTQVIFDEKPDSSARTVARTRCFDLFNALSDTQMSSKLVINQGLNDALLPAILKARRFLPQAHRISSIDFRRCAQPTAVRNMV